MAGDYLPTLLDYEKSIGKNLGFGTSGNEWGVGSSNEWGIPNQDVVNSLWSGAQGGGMAPYSASTYLNAAGSLGMDDVFKMATLKSLIPQQQPEPTWQDQYLSPLLKGVQGLGSLANIYLGFQGLDLAKKQMGLAKDQWRETKNEINRIRNVRNKINKQYMA